jgi:hypothetical protein
MFKTHRKPWSTIIRNHCQQKHPKIVEHHQKPYRKEFSQEDFCQEKCMRTGRVSFFLFPRNVWKQEFSFPGKIRLTVYKRHQIVIAELEIGAVGTFFFVADVMVGTRGRGKGQNMENNEKHAL